MKFISERYFNNKFTVAGVSFFLTLLLVFFSHPMFETHPLFNGEWQHHYYLDSAKNPFGYNFAPYCWRILIPSLIHFLKFDYAVSFFIVSFISIWLSGFAFFYVFKALKLENIIGFAGMILFFSSVYVSRYNLIEFAGVDATANLIILSAIYFMLKNKSVPLIVILTFGVAVKENALIVIPVYFTFQYYFRKENLVSSIKRTVAVGALPVIIFVLIRLLIPNENSYDFFVIVKEGIKFRYDTLAGGVSTFNKTLPFSENKFFVSIINFYRLTFGVWALIPLPMFFSKKIFEKKWTFLFVYLFFAYLQIFVAGDNERLVALAFPAVFTLSLINLNSFFEKYSINKNVIIVWVFALYIVQLFFFSDFYSETYFSVIAQIIITIPFLGYLLFKLKR